ncbi:hypothetical protein PC116_g8440 [Phytophthora cactorum]|nr:hypothetical protein PC116_g8440 [Phytophthora cactorum]
MPRRKRLTAAEYERIKVVNEGKLSNREIAKRLNRTEGVTRNFLKKSKRSQRPKNVGRPSIIDERKVRQIFLLAGTRNLFAKKIADLLPCRPKCIYASPSAAQKSLRKIFEEKTCSSSEASSQGGQSEVCGQIPVSIGTVSCLLTKINSI